MGFVFVDVHRKVIQKWVKKCQATLTKYEKANRLCSMSDGSNSGCQDVRSYNDNKEEK